MGSARILVFADDPEQKPRLYACPKCGSVHSPKIYLAREEVQHATARQAAENCYNCRTHSTCEDCGEQCNKGFIRCNSCQKQRVIAKAKHVSWEGVERCFGYSGEFYCSIEEAEDAGEEFVFAADFRPFRIDPDSVLDSILDDHHEDASSSDLVGVGDLVKAIDHFNDAQTSGSYDEDRTRIVMLAQAGHPTTDEAGFPADKADMERFIQDAETGGEDE